MGKSIQSASGVGLHFLKKFPLHTLPGNRCFVMSQRAQICEWGAEVHDEAFMWALTLPLRAKKVHAVSAGGCQHGAKCDGLLEEDRLRHMTWEESANQKEPVWRHADNIKLLWGISGFYNSFNSLTYESSKDLWQTAFQVWGFPSTALQAVNSRFVFSYFVFMYLFVLLHGSALLPYLKKKKQGSVLHNNMIIFMLKHDSITK